MDKKNKIKNSKVARFFKLLGPGLVTGASDDDPSGIATYSQAGAQFGLATLWSAFLTFPLMAAIQEMCARIGIVTKCGLAKNIIKHYPKFILYLTILFSFPAIILNIGADLAGMGAVTHLLIPVIPTAVFSILFTIILMIVIIYLPYQKFAAYLKYLCLSLLLYIIVPFLTKQNWFDVFKHTLVPHIQFNKEYISILVAILGTTISPYLFFWQATMEVEDVKHKNSNLIVNRNVIKKMNVDVDSGMFFSNLVMYFIILTTGTVLYNAGIHQVDTVEQAAKALEPVAGKLAYLLFASGVIGTGLLAIPVLSGSLSYILSEAFNWNGGLDKKYYEAKPFYLVIVIALLIGLAIDFIGISPIKALIYTAILYGVTAPILILIILHIANNEKIMGRFKNGILANVLGFITFALMSCAAILLLYFQFIG